jgi:xylulokinase
VVGTVHARAAAETGLSLGTPVVAGTVDAWAEAHSVGVRRPGDLMLMYASTMFFVLVTAERSQHPSIWNTAGVDPGSLTMAAGMATAGSLTAWLRELYGEPPFADLVAEAATVTPGSDGLLLLPYFAGERTPILDPRARGTITGLTLRHTRGHVYRAALEGIAYGARHNLEIMAGGQPVRAVAVGGGTQGRLWMQIVSDVTGLRQQVPAETVGACYGDALLAAEATGLTPLGTSWMRERAVVEPSAELRPLYDRLYGGFRELHPATREIQHDLAALQHGA